MNPRVPIRLPQTCSLLLAAALFLPGSLRAQLGGAPVQAAPAQSAAAGSASPSSSSDPNAVLNTNPTNALSAAQIDNILQQRPDILVEVKSLVADQLQQQGTYTQADAITDEMLYSQIARSADLRSSITLWMRSRGYISDNDVQRSVISSAANAADAVNAQLDAQADMQLGLTDGVQPLDNNGFPLSTNGLTPAQAQALAALSSSNGSSLGVTTPNSSPSTATSRAPVRVVTPRTTTPREPQQTINESTPALHLPAPYNLLSLRDLYTQVPQDETRLKRFGADVFLNRSASAFGNNQMPIDLPIGPDYVLGPGDGLTINLWGGISQSIARTVDHEGKIVLPEAGSLVVAGLTLQHAQSVIESALKQQFHNAQVDVTVARLRTVRVYVLGDVQRPNAYDLSSLSTPINALFAAGGPTNIGSLRIARHYRGAKLIREIDLYDFLLRGVRMDDERFESGDTLLIPPAGPQVAVSGMVRRPAVYELKGETTLAQLLEDAGGATVVAALDHITIDRIQPNQQHETVTLDASTKTPDAARQAISTFSVKDGDHVHVASILPYSERSIYVQGHVVRPGKFPYRDNMQLSDVLHSYQDLLPEPAARGDIVRLVAPDLHAETIQFDLADVLIGNNNVPLQPFDTIRIFGRYEVDSPQVTIRGEVLHPGAYALSRGMTAAQLVRMAGGFKRDALVDTADLTSYTIEDEKKIVSQRAAVSIGAAVRNTSAADVPLKPGDVLTIHQISGWNDIGASIELQGEVTYPGSYGLQEGEHLSSVLRRAGGFRGTAYPTGAILVRDQVKDLEQKSREDLIRQIESTSASARLAPNLTGQDETSLFQAAQQQQNEVLDHLRNAPISGRLVIHVSSDINSWAGTSADIEMRAGDILSVPKRPSFVLVSGQVYNASAITFVPGKTAGWYLQRAGGATEVANRGEIFIVRANGSVVGRRSGGWFNGNVLSTRLDPGDAIVVPQKIIGGSLFWRNLLTVAQISSSIAITAAVAGIL
jgi:protein involved in polysaccharide export with SLBB domain